MVASLQTRNAMIAREIHSSGRRRRSMVASLQTRNAEPDAKMIVGISLFFLFTNLPVSMYFVCYHYWEGHQDAKKIIYSALLHVSCINNAFNFVMYCLRGSTFRSALRDLVCRRFRPSVSPIGERHNELQWLPGARRTLLPGLPQNRIE